jgi:hypothetical protein
LVAGGAALAVAAGAFLWIQSSSRPSPSTGLAMGALVPSIAEPATSGQMLSLDQFRGSKIVVYFYEGAS